jgi:hypothetical protein
MRSSCRVGALAGALVILAACASGKKSVASQPPTPTPNPRVAPALTPPPPPAAAAVAVQQVPSPGPDAAYLEILRLQQSGSSEDALLAKVRAGKVRYDLTTAQILELRQAGVSEAVVEAMLRSGR